MDYLHLIIYIIAGAFGGFMAGMLGVGGGIVFIPIIQEIAKKTAAPEDLSFYEIANSLAIVLVVGISGSYKQYKLKNTDIKSAVFTGLFAIFSSQIVTWVLHEFELNNHNVFKTIYAVILVITGLRMWYSRKQIENESKIDEIQLPGIAALFPAGTFAGIITAITGLGGGVVMVPYFNKILKLPLKFSTGLSLSVIPIIAAPMLVTYMFKSPVKEVFPGLQTGYLMWTAIIPLIIAAGITSPLGVRVANKISSKTLLFIFMSFIAVNLLKIVFF